MMDLVKQVGPELGIVAACAAVGLARATYYRQLEPAMHGPAPKKLSPRELATDERKAVLAVLHEDRFVDLAPAEVYATLLDEGIVLPAALSVGALVYMVNRTDLDAARTDWERAHQDGGTSAAAIALGGDGGGGSTRLLRLHPRQARPGHRRLAV